MGRKKVIETEKENYSEGDNSIALGKKSLDTQETDFYEGSTLNVAGQEIPKYSAIELIANVDVTIKSTAETSILILQGRPIGEVVIQYGPFVMNTKEEINQAFEDYHQTKFGGWPWPKYDQVHARNKGRFAKHADGRLEEKS